MLFRPIKLTLNGHYLFHFLSMKSKYKSISYDNKKYSHREIRYFLMKYERFNMNRFQQLYIYTLYKKWYQITIEKYIENINTERDPNSPTSECFIPDALPTKLSCHDSSVWIKYSSNSSMTLFYSQIHNYINVKVFNHIKSKKTTKWLNNWIYLFHYNCNSLVCNKSECNTEP